MSEFIRSHQWYTGMMYVHPEDVETVTATRPVECEWCEHVYVDGEDPYGQCES
jgi:hypothetical protein